MTNSTDMFDLAILGSGPGGYVAAIRAAQLGMKVAVVEKDEVGGICLNWGCIPTKSLLRNAEIYRLFQRSKEFGIKTSRIEVDFPAVIKRSRLVSERLVKGVQYLLRKNQIEVINGSGLLTAQREIEVFDKTGKLVRTVAAKQILIATGARPRALPNVSFDEVRIITAKEAMLLQSIPASLVIIGAGAIGVEFAYFYNAFGTQVTLIEMMQQILPLEDKEIAELLQKILTKSGIKILTGAKVQTVSQKDGKLIVKVAKDSTGQEIVGELALVAIGVQGNVENLNLEQLGVQIEKSFIKVDGTYQTNVPGVYAIGDVIGPPLLAHVASAEGINAVECIAGKQPLPVNYKNIPSCTYCQPQVASLGMTEEKALAAGYEIKIGRFPFRANGKSLAYGDSEGLVKLIFDAKYGELLGAHILGGEATELIAELGVAKTLETTAQEIYKTIHAHPTMSEAIMEAAAASAGEAIQI